MFFTSCFFFFFFRLFFFFFLMIRRPPRSTLFPYTTSSDLAAGRAGSREAGPAPWYQALAGRPAERSEEHTSELLSRGHLVCRLLLEKKKKKLSTNYNQQKQNTLKS